VDVFGLKKNKMRIINKIKDIFSNRMKEMAPPFMTHQDKQQVINKYYQQYNLTTFIETGTFLGDMIEAQKNNFSKLYSIELSSELYLKAKERFKNEPKITIINGDSGVMLKKVLDEAPEDAILYWLDGHYSGGITAKGKLECPVLEELKIILSKKNKQVILIDDARLFKGKFDYPTIEELNNLLVEIDSSYKLTIELDIICILKK
jgi:hypothetical protein